MSRKEFGSAVIETDAGQETEASVGKGQSTINPGLSSQLRRLARSLGLLSVARKALRAVGRNQSLVTDLLERRRLTQIHAIEGALNRNGYSLQRFDSILDFACGSGRLAQYLPRVAPQARLFGCEINQGMVADCRSRCPQADVRLIGPTPPLDYEDGQFDFIFTYSVFTNLPEHFQRAWLEDLGRKLRPGGVMLHTTHSYENLRRVAMFSPQVLAQFKLPEPVDEFIAANRGFYYVPYSPENPDYGLAIISRDYVKENWPAYSGLALVDYNTAAIEGHPSGPQDIVIMAKEAIKRYS